MGTIRDELIKHFQESTAPKNTFASAAEPNSNTYPARQSNVIGNVRDLPSLFAGEHTAGESNLPMQVSASEIAAENRVRWGNLGPADSEAAAPLLSGTKIAGGDNEV